MAISTGSTHSPWFWAIGTKADQPVGRDHVECSRIVIALLSGSNALAVSFDVGVRPADSDRIDFRYRATAALRPTGGVLGPWQNSSGCTIKLGPGPTPTRSP